MNQPFPKKLSPTPIISAAIELKFKLNETPVDAVFGIVYNELKDIFPDYDSFPISKVPIEALNEEALNSQPHYRLYNKNTPYSILLGPSLIVFVYTKKTNNTNYEYPGWTNTLSGKISSIFRKFFNLKIINKITRLGIRYSDFFEENIIDNTEYILMDKNSNSLGKNRIQIIQTLENGNIKHNLLISNNAEYHSLEGNKDGSVVDIDTYMDIIPDDFQDNLEKYLEECHIQNKNLFYETVKKDLIDKFNPEL